MKVGISKSQASGHWSEVTGHWRKKNIRIEIVKKQINPNRIDQISKNQTFLDLSIKVWNLNFGTSIENTVLIARHYYQK